jgi:hypothetical protein
LRWRQGLEALVRDLAAIGEVDSVSVEAMRRRFGARWLWSWKEVIANRALCLGVDRQTGEIL